jgi:hypothetical protein
MTIQTKPASDAFREGWGATFRRSATEVSIKPGDTMRRLPVGGVAPKSREQYEREVALMTGYGPITYEPIPPEPTLPEEWEYHYSGVLTGPNRFIVRVNEVPSTVIRWLAWKAGVKL